MTFAQQKRTDQDWMSRTVNSFLGRRSNQVLETPTLLTSGCGVEDIAAAIFDGITFTEDGIQLAEDGDVTRISQAVWAELRRRSSLDLPTWARIMTAPGATLAEEIRLIVNLWRAAGLLRSTGSTTMPGMAENTRTETLLTSIFGPRVSERT